MACTISFTIGKSAFPSIENIDSKVLWGEGGDLSPQDLFKNIVKVLKKAKIDEDSAYNQLVQAINTDLTNNLVDFSTEKIKDFDGTSVANANVEYLRTLYPDIDFPKGIETQILIRDLLEPNSTKPVVGRVIDEKGKEIIILRNNRLSMLRLAQFLKLKQAMQDPEFLEKIPKELIDELNEVAKEFKMPSIADLALQFDIDLTTFYDSKFKTSSGRSPVTVLEELSIYASGHTPVNYTSNTLNELKRRIKYFKGGAYLNMSNFFDTILSQGEWGEVMKALNIESGQSLVEFFNKDNYDVVNNILSAELTSLLPTLKDPDVRNFVQNLAQNVGREDISPIQGFFDTITSLRQIHEPLFSYEVAEIKKGKTTSITFTSIYPTLERSGVGFETRKNFIEVGRKGPYRIYQRTEEDGTKYYYVSRHIIGAESYNHPYLSLQDAQDYATQEMNKMTLEDASLITLRKSFNEENEESESEENKETSQARTFELNYKIPEDTIVEIIPFKISKNKMLAKEYMLFNKTLNDFYNYIDELFGEAIIQKNDVIKIIDTPEKAAIFLSELNNPDRKFNIVNEDTQEVTYIRNNYQGMLELAQSIAAKEPKYYYIRKTKGTRKGIIYSELDKKARDKKFENVKTSFRHYYIPIEGNKPEEVRQNPRIPVIKTLESIATVLNEKFGVPVHVINGEYINQEQQTKEGKFYNKDINQSAKAFIVDGEIYVNTDEASVQDLFHEYTHLFLGVLKANNFKVYQQLLEHVSQYADFKNAIVKKQKLYPNRSYYDLMEEVFADLYGEWIENNLPRDISKAFENISSTEEVKEVQFNVFDKTADGSNKGLQYLFGGKQLATIWRRFNKDVSRMLSDKENLSFMRSNDLKLQRQQSNWIENQIRIYKEQKKANPEKEDKDLEGIKEVCV